MKDSSNTPPPIICVNDRVLLHYAVLDESVGYTAGHGLFFVGGKEIGRVPCLAICQNRDSSRFTLYYCDSDWGLVGVGTDYESVVAAKRRAERIYPGSSARWIEANFTEEDVARYLDEAWSGEQCSFCGKKPYETVARFFGTNENARICADCIVQFNSELNNPSEPEK
jgi:hypothetical protein